MKANEIRPCDYCGKQIAGRMPDGEVVLQFYVVKLSTALLNVRAVNAHVGLATMFGGNHVLAEVFNPHSEWAQVLAEQPGGFWDEALLCRDCYYKPVDLCHLTAILNERREREAEKKEAPDASA